MRRSDGKVLFSATDLMRFMGCTHATTLDLAYMNGQGPHPRPDSADAALLQAHGDAHEKAHLARLMRSPIARPQWCELAQASIATTQGGCAVTVWSDRYRFHRHGSRSSTFVIL